MNKTFSYNRLPVIIVAVLALLAGVWVYTQDMQSAANQPRIDGMLWPNPKPLTPFKLTDQHGEPLTIERLKGRWSFLFFGYTHCPDICPATLGVMDQVSKIKHASKDIQYIFVSVDPARDTPKHLSDYLAYFNESFIGATDTEPYLQSLTRQLGIIYFLGEPREDGLYDVDHTASIVLIDPQGRFIGVFGAPHDAKEISRRFDQMRQIVEKG